MITQFASSLAKTLYWEYIFEWEVGYIYAIYIARVPFRIISCI